MEDGQLWQQRGGWFVVCTCLHALLTLSSTLQQGRSTSQTCADMSIGSLRRKRLRLQAACSKRSTTKAASHSSSSRFVLIMHCVFSSFLMSSVFICFWSGLTTKVSSFLRTNLHTTVNAFAHARALCDVPNSSEQGQSFELNPNRGCTDILILIIWILFWSATCDIYMQARNVKYFALDGSAFSLADP